MDGSSLFYILIKLGSPCYDRQEGRDFPVLPVLMEERFNKAGVEQEFLLAEEEGWIQKECGKEPIILPKKLDFSTRTVHAGQEPCPHTGALNPPIYQTATFAFPDVETGVRRFTGEEQGYIYTRLGNPTQEILEKKMADLEGGEDALATASGMGAISALIMSQVREGEHIVASRALYGSTHAFLRRYLVKYGVETTFVEPSSIDNFRAAIREETKLIYVETPVNPTLQIVDLAAVARLGKEMGITTAVDNTFMSPYLQRPLELGFDYVVHSATKYIGGHGDVVAGIIVGPGVGISRIREGELKELGAVISPFNAWLLLRGLKTLAIRMDRICHNAQEIAEYLQDHPLIARVNYPGLPAHPDHQLAQRQADGFGGMISFELEGGLEAGKVLMNAVGLCHLAVSLGDVDTLIQHPASMTHFNVSRKERAAMGITDGLVRLSVGIEAAVDIIADLDQALVRVQDNSIDKEDPI
ncbi:MAG: aminotransferase class I/II-fold pyridoxal phosphate-dependent enzyme [Halanaerobium sp.]|nr:aminotransferase class I/II-fold pyridoxal phosphate-dependent enzyme [Halanaerobium sp.]